MLRGCCSFYFSPIFGTRHTSAFPNDALQEQFGKVRCVISLPWLLVHCHKRHALFKLVTKNAGLPVSPPLLAVSVHPICFCPDDACPPKYHGPSHLRRTRRATPVRIFSQR